MFDCGFTKENNWFRYRAAAIIVENDCVLFAGNEKENYYYSVGGGVHMGESSEEAVKREVYEETGIEYEVDRLAIIHENFFYGLDNSLKNLECHEVCFYYLMKPKGNQELKCESFTQGTREYMYWLPIKDLDNYRHFPSFMKSYLENIPDKIVHIVTDERIKNK